MHQNKKRVRLIYFIIDIFCVMFSFYLPCKINPILMPQALSASTAYLSVFGFWGVIIIFLLNNAQLYFTDRRISITEEWLKVLKCVCFSVVLTALFIFGLKIVVFSRIIFTEIAFLLLFFLSTWRVVKRIYIRDLIKKGYLNYNVLLVGAGKIGLTLSNQINMFPYLGIRIIGFLDDNQTGNVGGFKILGKVKDLDTVVKEHFVDEIYVTIPSERKLASEVIAKGTKLGRTVRIVAEFFDLPHRHVGLNYIGTVPLMTYFEKGLHGSEQSVKRLMDIFISSLILILITPLWGIIVVLIKIESPGPIFYIAKRCGRKGRIFNFYKFRSMFAGANDYKESLRNKSEVIGPIFKIKNDPRITRIGRLLRKYSLDELPQLINVLKGDMSLVGPRPFPVEESQKVENRYIPRLNIKPGITGLAQIKGRSDLSFHHWAKWDLWYVDNWSFSLDLRILWLTIPAVLKGKGAY